MIRDHVIDALQFAQGDRVARAVGRRAHPHAGRNMLSRLEAA
ncbi:hypothetical protein [Caballeronia sp. Lep1P3]|nr:hypothetical protein [Caballeronia sp. Lep1P3]